METVIDGEVCIDIKALAHIFGVRTQTVNKYALYDGMPHYRKGRFYIFPRDRCITWYKKWREMKGKFTAYRNSEYEKSLCFDCQRPLMGKDTCSWHKEAVPVEGWLAKKTEISYAVKYCPLFIPDLPHKRAKR